MTVESDAAPGGDVSSSAELTPGELAFMNSGGENADLLLSENAGAAAGADAGAADATAAAGVVGNAAAGAGDAGKVNDAGGKAAVGTAAAAATIAAPAAGTEDDPDVVEVADGKGGKSRHVPFGKFERERKRVAEANQRAEALQGRVDELSEKFARGDERLRLLAEALNPQQDGKTGQAEDDPKPDPQKDIFAYVAWQDRQIERLKGDLGETRETVTTDQADRTLRDGYQRDAVAFARETPDFGPAYNYLLTQRAGMLVEQGYAEKEVRQILHNEEKGLVERAAQTGKRPAQLIYGLAKQLGWRPEMATAANGHGSGAAATGGAANGSAATAAAAGANGNGAAPNGHANGANGAAPSVTDEIARIAAAQVGNKSLSGGGGPASELTVEALAALSDKEFEALYATKKAQIDRLMGMAN
jgi:hypothetical protein